MVSDTVVAIVSENVLPALLSQIHRAGLGQNARVLRPHRHPIQYQLERAGIPIANMPPRVNDAEAVLMVMAAGRAPIAADLALQSGASAVWIVSRSASWSLVDDHDVAEAPLASSARTPTPAHIVPETELPGDSAD